MGFSGGSDSRVCLQCRRPGFSPWVGKLPWRRKWQPTAVSLPGKSHGRRSLYLPCPLYLEFLSLLHLSKLFKSYKGSSTTMTSGPSSHRSLITMNCFLLNTSLPHCLKFTMQSQHHHYLDTFICSSPKFKRS